ncbi:MAG: hypothetical protein JW841_11770 [Deltaproteobacteria bacterium]|nr:hypothetical protein [Deltaproteobacteria bacterium]
MQWQVSRAIALLTFYFLFIGKLGFKLILRVLIFFYRVIAVIFLALIFVIDFLLLVLIFGFAGLVRFAAKSIL